MRAFELARAPREGEVSVSIKVRVVSGCFHREHSPHAYALIDKHLASRAARRPEFGFVEHESGPELLVYLALGTAGITLAKSVIDLVTAIVKARSEGIKKGDRPSDPLEVIVRRVGDGDKFVEETVLRIGHADPLSREELQVRIEAAVKRLIEDKMAEKANRTAPRTRRKGRANDR
jgi:hypothetical protein